MDGKFTNSVASPSDSLEGAHAHAINTRPSFLPRGSTVSVTAGKGAVVSLSVPIETTRMMLSEILFTIE